MPSSQLLKGALIYQGVPDDFAQPVVFQFNPETLTRLQVYAEKANVLTESIRFTLVLNAMEGMENNDPDVVEQGIYPQIAALEELLEQQTKLQRDPGGWPKWLFPPRSVGYLLFVYGERTIPVKIQRLTIKEQLHNSQLKPLHASVDITLRVLTKNELKGNVEGLMMLAMYKQYRQAHVKSLDQAASAFIL